MSIEKDVLDKIKFVLLSGNESQAIRLIEQYGFDKEEKIKEEQSKLFGVSHRRELLNLKDFVKGQQDLPDGINELVNDNFWDLL